MGVLDDAIKQHLELKRKHGAAEHEVREQEEEALGPPRSTLPPAPPESQTVEPQLTEPDLPTLAGPLPDEETMERPSSRSDELGFEAESAPPARPRQAEPLSGAGSSQETVDFTPDFALDEERVADERLQDERIDEEPLAGERLAEEGSRDEPFTEEHFNDERIQDAPFDEGRAGRLDRAPAQPPPPMDRDVFLDEDRGRLDQAPPEAPAPLDRNLRPQEEEHDVLEDTPEFLDDAPEHDRLWFEQRPPRDFDFDD